MQYQVVINEKGGGAETKIFDRDEITIGRVKDNDIVLPKNNISKRHARIVLKDGKFKIVDLKSTNGTYINGRRIDGPYDLKDGDKIYVGDFTLELEATEYPHHEPVGKKGSPPPPPSDNSGLHVVSPPAPASDWDAISANAHAPTDSEEGWGAPSATGRSSAAKPGDDFDLDSLLADAGAEARSRGGLSENQDDEPKPVDEDDFEAMSAGHHLMPKNQAAKARPREPEEATPEPVKPPSFAPLSASSPAIAAAPSDEAPSFTPSAVKPEQATKRMGAITPGRMLEAGYRSIPDGAFGPLEALMHDDEVQEIMVNGPADVYVERRGRVERADCHFSDPQALLSMIEDLISETGGVLDRASPLFDARLPDGSRLTAALAPLATSGAALTIRKPRREALALDALVSHETLSAEMASFLDACVKNRRTVLISGGAGSGKTALLGALASRLAGEHTAEETRVFVLEEQAALKLPLPNVVALETRSADLQGHGEVTMRALLHAALRMRPDRLVIDDCRRGEAFDILQAAYTGCEGLLFTMSATTPRDALARFETLALMGSGMGGQAAPSLIREQIVRAVAVIVQLTKFDGGCKITHIAEVTGIEGDAITSEDIFVFEQTGFDTLGRAKGTFRATGQVPKFYEELKARGIHVDVGIFR